MLISGSVNAEVFETWLAEHLCRELTAPSVLILDKARFHRPEVIEAIATAAGHQVLFLPPYSPDFNKIEHDFAALKRILAYAPEGWLTDKSCLSKPQRLSSQGFQGSSSSSSSDRHDGGSIPVKGCALKALCCKPFRV
jgi:putative transposase